MDPFQTLGQLKTLLVDDDELIRDSFGLIFDKKNCPLDIAATAEEGLQLLARQSYDVIISDFQLPGMNGLEMFKKAHRSHPRTVKILVSGHINEKDLTHTADELDLSFVPKPFNVSQLADVIVALMADQE